MHGRANREPTHAHTTENTDTHTKRRQAWGALCFPFSAPTQTSNQRPPPQAMPMRIAEARHEAGTMSTRARVPQHMPAIALTGADPPQTRDLAQAEESPPTQKSHYLQRPPTAGQHTTLPTSRWRNASQGQAHIYRRTQLATSHGGNAAAVARCRRQRRTAQTHRPIAATKGNPTCSQKTPKSTSEATPCTCLPVIRNRRHPRKDELQRHPQSSTQAQTRATTERASA